MDPNNHELYPPKFALYGAALMICVAISMAVLGRQTGIGTVTVPEGNAVAARDLTFADSPDGSVIVKLAPSNDVVAILPPGNSGFVRVVMRGLARHRKGLGIGDEEPFRLTYWDNNRLSIEDPLTGRSVQLGAFGEPNRQAFAQLLIAKGENQ